ncbi:uncharacterized protein NESG_00682 [Nematocida ausubeli]|uniref:Thioredoxin domain-containing protein n=1 Tax=Nematocida ausubeli (strain ATCC PRA-371 / ERTm2) TaxID=1913371 RepID=A0A086J315_NEMA1|nr:uncharacterized protein NESG_00682 [Nematocida ausubeli]KAI5132361.1 hypothetical protein NEAUS07_0123 [Nematocida ausubeli]KFG26533.1 hypothetical protein NESG_00682 [Nematocida ausubeli]
MIRQALLYLFIVHYVIGQTYNTCKVTPPSFGYSITKYYRDQCVHCKSISPKIQKIVDSMERKQIDINLYNVDTAACYNETEEIDVIPTIIVHKDGKQLLKFSGDLAYDKIVDLFVSKTGLNKNIFEKEVPAPTEILSLTKNDFLSSFNGPWIVYFDNGYDHLVENILLETYKSFNTEIKIAKYVGADKEIVAGRYYIYDFPGILVMYDGILMRYNGNMTLPAFHEFCSKLVEPSFKDITADKLSNIVEPTFVVFYSDVVLANRAFRRIAHDLKMNATTYKMKIETTESDPILRLAVFKNGNKFYYDGDINNEGDIREWLFHAHFPNTSKLGMDNFYSIFHGLKPVVSIITDSGNPELEDFEEIALENNRGTSSSPYVFTFVDKTEYPKFTETNFGNLDSSSIIVFFDPQKQIFYGRKRNPKESIRAYFDTQLAQYKDGVLPKYTKHKPGSYKLAAFGVCGLAALGGGLRYLMSRKNKAALE